MLASSALGTRQRLRAAHGGHPPPPARPAHPHLHPTIRVPALLSLPLVPPWAPQAHPQVRGMRDGVGHGTVGLGLAVLWWRGGSWARRGPAGQKRVRILAVRVDFPNFPACLLLYRPPASSRRAKVEQRRSEAAEQATAGCRRTPKLAQ